MLSEPPKQNHRYLHYDEYLKALRNTECETQAF